MTEDDLDRLYNWHITTATTQGGIVLIETPNDFDVLAVLEPNGTKVFMEKMLRASAETGDAAQHGHEGLLFSVEVWKRAYPNLERFFSDVEKHARSGSWSRQTN